MRPKSRTLTERELDVMKVVWKLKTATVRQVYEECQRSSHKAAYTTIMTIMKVLQEKEYLEKSAEGRAHIYVPTRPKSEVISGMVQEFVDRVFNGSAAPLLLNLVKDQNLSEEDLGEIARTIQESE